MRHVVMILSVMVLGATVLSNDAYAKIAFAQVRIQVVDQDGCVVPDAKIWGGFTCGGGMNDYVLVDGFTDTNGLYVAEGWCNEILRFEVRKEGYYRTSVKIEFWRTKSDPKVKDGKWQPYGEMRTVVLKRIKNPIKMVEVPYRINKAIALGKWYGYDLICSDWIPPYGKGEHLDVLVRLGLAAVNDTSDFRTTMELCFTNNPYSGVYKVCQDNWSEMKSVYNADTNAVYQNEIAFEFERHPRKPIIDTRLSEDSYLVFRIRTKVGASGELVSAHYGKICGPWAFFGAMTAPDLFFNPTPNDTNLEDAETARKSRLGYKQSLEFGRRRKAGGK